MFKTLNFRFKNYKTQKTIKLIRKVRKWLNSNKNNKLE